MLPPTCSRRVAATGRQQYPASSTLEGTHSANDSIADEPDGAGAQARAGIYFRPHFFLKLTGNEGLIRLLATIKGDVDEQRLTRSTMKAVGHRDRQRRHPTQKDHDGDAQAAPRRTAARRHFEVYR